MRWRRSHQPGDHRETSEDVYTTTLLQLDEIFNPQQSSCVQVDTVCSRPVQDGIPAHRSIRGKGQHGGLPPRGSQQVGAGILLAEAVSSLNRPASSPAGGPAASLPVTSSARAGSCFRCGSSQHWADTGARPARCRTCVRCGHFARVCQPSAGPPASSSPGPSTMTNAVAVRQEDAIPIPAASPSSPGGVPGCGAQPRRTARALEPPSSLTASVCSMSEPHALHSSDVSSLHAVSHMFASWPVLFASARKCAGVPDCSCVVLELPLPPAKDLIFRLPPILRMPRRPRKRRKVHNEFKFMCGQQ
ncbi:hypothetical protein HPB50_026968 [Hyalomma asiaticum]|uniref:Uncharacterized protein n=1 Tax=Hyalomma asiaticum TaxID=266040 RepID=A0ACB7SZP2_HYAAI|nr:hypothetical protein HPB50_026968 [Hyalomma asiaticum]